MAELNAQIAPSPAVQNPDDPLASLHKMSTTAGLASRDYVAVNTTAVIAALLGVASALALFANILLVIPLVGIIVSLVAWRQIVRSSGTETGKSLAAGGLLLSALMAGSVFTMQAREAARAREDARQVESVIQSLGSAINEGRPQEAYEMFDTAFRDRVSARDFTETWRFVARSDSPNGKFRGLRWNQISPAYETVSTGVIVVADAIVDFEHNQDQRLRFALRKAGDRLYIHDIPLLFPSKAKTPLKWPGAKQ